MLFPALTIFHAWDLHLIAALRGHHYSQAIGITSINVILKPNKGFFYLTVSYLRSGTEFIIHFHIPHCSWPMLDASGMFAESVDGLAFQEKIKLRARR